MTSLRSFQIDVSAEEKIGGLGTNPRGSGMVLIAVLIFLTSCHPMQRDDKVPTVEVSIGDSVGKVKGHVWPKRDDGSSRDITGLDDPCNITVHFPSGKAFSSWTNTVFMDQENRILKRVSIVPLTDRVTYLKAIGELERIARELKVDEHPRWKRAVDAWRKEKPAEDIPHSRSMEVPLENNINVWLEMKYDTKHNGWYVIVKFTIPLDEK
ncbi:MAG: hypothetical protein K2R98_31105 [Gemmataceae bacterium]|nr:hypothetical protein [Gemmataceae bacterium]